jgi:hypothetical protein
MSFLDPGDDPTTAKGYMPAPTVRPAREIPGPEELLAAEALWFDRRPRVIDGRRWDWEDWIRDAYGLRPARYFQILRRYLNVERDRCIDIDPQTTTRLLDLAHLRAEARANRTTLPRKEHR